MTHLITFLSLLSRKCVYFGGHLRFRVTKSERKDFTDYVNVERDKVNCRIAMDEFGLG